MDKKKFLFVSLDGLIADGFVPKRDDWVKDVPWADVIVFDDVLGQGHLSDGMWGQGLIHITTWSRGLAGGRPQAYI